MSVEENKAIMQRVWQELFNEGKTEIIDELYHNDYVFHGPGGHEVKGIEGFKKLNAWLHTSFPSMHFTVNDLIAEGDKVVTHYTMKGTDKRNKQVNLQGIIINRIVGGKVAEEWEVFDRLVMASQLAPGWAKAFLNLIEKKMEKDLP